MTILLIDADLVAYRCAASVAEDAPLDFAVARCDRLMHELLHVTQCDHYCGYLTGGDNFRKTINKEYKANRKDMVPPKWLQQCREFLIKEWKCKLAIGCEADDLLGINQDKSTHTTIIASLDKDLMMIPGKHYNWMHDTHAIVDKMEGIKTFYKQMLIGDVSDNVIGVAGIGKVKAAKRIDPLTTEQEMIEVVFDLYKEDAARFYMNAQCLWILQNEGETWAKRVDNSILPDLLKQELEAMSDSMISLMVVI